MTRPLSPSRSNALLPEMGLRMPNFHVYKHLMETPAFPNGAKRLSDVYIGAFIGRRIVLANFKRRYGPSTTSSN